MERGRRPNDDRAPARLAWTTTSSGGSRRPPSGKACWPPTRHCHGAPPTSSWRIATTSRWHRAEARIPDGGRPRRVRGMAATRSRAPRGRMRHVSSAQPPLLVMLLRASTQGELGFAKRPHREIIEHLTGYRITRDMLKKAADPRRGGVAPVIELGVEDARALAAWQVAWPNDPVHRLATGLGSSPASATRPCPGALP